MELNDIITNKIMLERATQKSPPSKSLEFIPTTQRLISSADIKEHANERGKKSYFQYFTFVF